MTPEETPRTAADVIGGKLIADYGMSDAYKEADAIMEALSAAGFALYRPEDWPLLRITKLVTNADEQRGEFAIEKGRLALLHRSGVCEYRLVPVEVAP